MDNNKLITKKGSGESLRQSLAYSTVGNLGAKGLSLLGFFVLARLLSPRDFGLMSMVMVFAGIADLFLNMGMDAALIQNRQANERHFSTVFWLNCFLGAIFSALMISGAGVIAGFYKTSEIVLIIRTVAVVFVLDAIVIIPIALLKKRQQFKQIASIGFNFDSKWLIYWYTTCTEWLGNMDRQNHPHFQSPKIM